MNVFRFCLALSGCSVLAYAVVSAPRPVKRVDFNRDIRPILSNKCTPCHGNDKNSVEAGLMLLDRAIATSRLKDGHTPIVPGSTEKSELVRRIHAPADSGMMMPPTNSNKVLSDEEKALLTQWIKEGAEYKQHWAFVKPLRSPLPAVQDASWCKTPIDRFVLAKLEEEGLKPSPQADRATLLRRVSLDLIGLQPTPKELDDFLKDRSPNAYEKVVDRLLASPRYGERMAMDWMDYARYADSNGYQADWERFQWVWRDWVINAFNKNMPYDRFTVEQLAGDLLPHPTRDQIIATGFNRNHRINTEGGVIAEEWRVENVIDRTETTSTVWLGLTTGCARCHDHKYDPISQRDFYSLCAYFNNVPESGTGEERPVNHPPFIQAPNREQELTQRQLIAEKERLTQQVETAILNDRSKAENWAYTPPVPPATLSQARLAKLVFKSDASGLTLIGKPTFEAGKATGAVVTNEQNALDLGNVGDFEAEKPFSYAAWVFPQGGGSPFSRMDVGKDFRGWDLFMAGGKAAVHIINKWPENALKVLIKNPVQEGQWSHFAVTYDGSRKASGVKFYVNGQKVETEVEKDTLTGSIHADVTLKVGRRTGGDTFNGKVDDLTLYTRVLSDPEVAAVANIDPVKPIVAIPVANRTRVQRKELSRYWARQNETGFVGIESRLEKTTKDLDQLNSKVPTVMIMKELDPPRIAYVLRRGLYDQHGQRVTMATPAALPPLPKGVPNNRLGLARWIVSRDNPLTARVTVNRMWERFFGQGIVASGEDFGTRADFPSHPELLDWMAVEFMDRGWDLKAMMKEIAMSAAYQQSSNVTPALLAKDPTNKLISRGPRFRLPAEVLRDQALFASDSLAEKIGGPSARPYAPKGMWDEFGAFGNLRNYMPDKGAGSHRRSLYTIWKRTAAPPDMTLFDAPSRETCRVTRARTDTPLQALVLLNDETYIEASRLLAERALREGPRSAEGRIGYIYECLLARKPSPQEARILLAGLTKRMIAYKANPSSAEKLLKVGNVAPDHKFKAPELAAYTLVASTLLNTDEAVTKE